MKRIVLLLTVFLFLMGCSSQAPDRSQAVRHIILWTLNDSIDGVQRENLISTTCRDFYTLEDKIPGIISMSAIYEGRLSSSNCDFMFDITFESEEALRNFSTHPEHLKSAGKLKPYIKSRACFDVLCPR